MIASDPAMEMEVGRLRTQVGELMTKVADAEAGRRRAEADVEALRAGVDPDALRDPMGDAPPAIASESRSEGHPPTDAATTPDPEPADEGSDARQHPDGNRRRRTHGKSLRGRLVDSVTSRKGKPTDVQEWR